jgi:FkbM family methyltransferase
VKRLLKMCGHAFVITVHERLDGLDRQVENLNARNLSLAETQTAALQALIHIVESQRQIGEALACLNTQNLSLAESQTAILQASIHIVEEGQRQIGEELSTVHARLDVAERQADKLNAQNLSLAETQTAILRASIHIVEGQRQLGEELARGLESQRQLSEELARSLEGQRQISEGLARGLESQRQVGEELARGVESQRQLGEELARGLESQRQVGEELARGLESQRHLCEKHARGLESQRQISEGLARGLESQRQVGEELARGLESQRQISEGLAGQVSVETSDYEFTNPETGLMEYLYSYLPTRGAIDAGAHTGDVSECLLRSGYQVYAFEPFPPVYEKLVSRLGGHEGFHPFNFALGCDEGEMPLHLAQDLSGSGKYGDVTVFSSLAAHSMPDDLPFVSFSTVMVKNLANLHREGVIPAGIGLVKIDTEGFDLEVIRGMGDFRYPVVCAEFWDAKIPFGQSGVPYTLDSLVREMKKLGYVWHIVLYRIWGRDVTAFYGNHHRSVPESWGNVFFFRDFGLFSQGQAWCSAVLPGTYFRSVPAKQTRAERQTSPA